MKKFSYLAKRIARVTAVSAFVISCFSVNAFALEYSFNNQSYGQTFYQSTSTDINHIGDSDQIVIGADGTIANNVTGNVSSSPYSPLNIPIGTYPEAYAETTDLAIANNTNNPWELGPTATNVNLYRPTYTSPILNGSLPNGGDSIISMIGSSGNVTTSSNIYTGSYTGGSGSGLTPTTSITETQMAVATGAVTGVSTNEIPMPEVSTAGAIGQLTISSIGLNKYVYEGASDANMARGLGHIESTAGWLGNVAIAGHNRGTNIAHFANLKNVQVGDTVTWTTAYGVANYVVTEINERNVNDTSGLLQDGTNKLTLYTCKENQPDLRIEVVASLVGIN